MQEDIVAKLIEFLVAPYATTTVLLAEKEKVCLPCTYSPPDFHFSKNFSFAMYLKTFFRFFSCL